MTKFEQNFLQYSIDGSHLLTVLHTLSLSALIPPAFLSLKAQAHLMDTPVTPTVTQISGMQPLSSQNYILCISTHTWIQDHTQQVSVDRLALSFQNAFLF